MQTIVKSKLPFQLGDYIHATKKPGATWMGTAEVKGVVSEIGINRFDKRAYLTVQPILGEECRVRIESYDILFIPVME